MARPPEKPLAIVAEDDPHMRQVLERLVAGAGYRPRGISDGGELWPCLETERPALLLVDLHMPGMNGWEVLRRLRSDFRFREHRRDLMVVVISGQSDEETRDFVLRLGAHRFFGKPLDLEELMSAIAPPPKHGGPND